MLPARAPSTSACNEEQVTAVDVGTGEGVGALVGATVDVGTGVGVGALLGGTVDVGAAAGVGAMVGDIVGLAAGCGVAAPGLGGAETGADVPLNAAVGVAIFADGDVDFAAAAFDGDGALLTSELACT